jgi:NDP-sugar pyrophosphorylase family protein
MKPTLLILAAGMGSRVGPNGEIIIDYSIHDAIRADFGKLVFVIRHYFEEAFKEKIGSRFEGIAFKEKIGSRFEGIVETAYAYQELDTCLDGFELPEDREKPWGTGHAILVAQDVIDEPFAVINADGCPRSM